jgi:ABC-type nitrate/sulfonate/bicarbonate transport system permease component
MAANDALPAASAKRATGRISPLAIRVGSVLFVLLAWEIIGRRDPLFTSYPTAVAEAAVDTLVRDGELISAFGTTLWALGVGFAISVAIGVPLGFALARIKVLGIAADPYVAALYATPRITLIPLLVLWVGIDAKLRITIVVLASIFPIIINVRDGAREVERSYVDAARSFAATKWQVWRTVVLPASLPYVFVALRLGAQHAIIGVIVAEMTAALAGTGQVLLDYAQFFRTDRLMVPILIIGFFSIFITWGLDRLQARLSPWKSTRRGPSR